MSTFEQTTIGNIVMDLSEGKVYLKCSIYASAKILNSRDPNKSRKNQIRGAFFNVQKKLKILNHQPITNNP